MLALVTLIVDVRLLLVLVDGAMPYAIVATSEEIPDFLGSSSLLASLLHRLIPRVNTYVGRRTSDERIIPWSLACMCSTTM